MTRIRTLILPLLVAATAACATTAEFAALRPTRAWDVAAPNGAAARFDPSGLHREGEHWLVVSDKSGYDDIYRLSDDGAGGLRAETHVSPRFAQAPPAGDYEGLAFCRGVYLVVEEKSGSLISVQPDGAAEWRGLDLLAPHLAAGTAPAGGTRGAGLEGVACDEDGGRTIVANERQFRMLYTVPLGTTTADGYFDVPAGWGVPRRVGEHTVEPDFADLHFTDGMLYALQRNERTVLKIDVKKRALVDRRRLAIDETRLYDYRDPFGMAEGLFVTADEIYVLLDNNGAPRRGRPEDRRALLLAFPRPAGF